MRYEKIAPGLLVALDRFKKKGLKGLIQQTRALGIVSAVDSPKPPRTVVFIHCDEKADLDHLNKHGIRVNQRSGRVRTAFLPLDSLEPLSEDPSVERIIPSRYLRPLMDVAPGKVHLPEFRHELSLNGKGVIIGVIDSGIDPKHPAFQGRILRIWDQNLHGDGVPEGDYGEELTGRLTVSRDFDGHGSHVAGIAASNDSTYGGVAPEADLLIVKTDFNDAHIADGIRYIFRIAGELGRPAVINLSLGAHWDAHDGTDSLSQVIDSESGPGRIVCTAAGNEGNDNIHAQHMVPKGMMRTSRFRVPSDSADNVFLNGWYPGSMSMEISVRTPKGFATPFQKVIASGDSELNYSLPEGEVRIATPGPDPANGDHNFLIQISGVPLNSVSKQVTAGVWQLRMRNKSTSRGRVDIWIMDNLMSQEVFFSGTSVKDSMKIGSPGAASKSITVASYTTKVKWTDINGQQQKVELILDDISEFSSEGPLRNDVEKPEVAAPGAMIVSTLSADSRPANEDMIDSGHRVMAGTSMATPFLTGIVALLLERNTALDPNEVKTQLRECSHIPGKQSKTFDPKWGFGLIDVLFLKRLIS
jgi:subtilisin family serine protease